ncbi:hypothetical protein KKG41_02360 [Patescibacteria group bacterium]|nr:hypothetical protein [Patescibacteria group bacterium]MBU1889876.1 hypothetical protein [Patescibacteria group bacterium]
MNSLFKHRSKSQTIFSIIVIVELVVIIFLAYKVLYEHNPDMSFDIQNVRKNNNIQNKDSITCHVVHSTHGNYGLSLWQYELSEFEIVGLNSDVVQLVINGKSWGIWHVLYNGEDYISIMTEASWDVDTIGIRKTTGTFVRTTHGDQAVWTDFGQYAIAQKGWCE